MSLALGMILSVAIIAYGGASIAGFLIWLQKRDGARNKPQQDVRHA